MNLKRLKIGENLVSMIIKLCRSPKAVHVIGKPSAYYLCNDMY